MITVGDLARALSGARVVGDAMTAIAGCTHDSRRVGPGLLFAALPGERTDGLKYVDDARERGAVALLLQKPLPGESLPQICVSDVRAALGPAAAACYGHPTESLELVGITGTNGKTTTAYLVEAALASTGARPGVMGTVEYRLGTRRWQAEHTTPEAPVVQAVASEMLEAGASHLVAEVSSHGLSLRRLDGCAFRVAAFTNLTQDHLDFHGTMEAYAAAKLELFTRLLEDRRDARVAVNVDDPFGATIPAAVSHPVLTVSCDPGSDAGLRPAVSPVLSIDGISAEIVVPGGIVRLASPLLGAHNLANLLLALAICSQLGVDLEKAAAGLGALAAVPGRLERVSKPGQPAVLVDYAHTPDALERVLEALRPLTKGRLLCVFGCGGDRDQRKRPLMGRAVGRGADLRLVTSDNPRTEDPQSIIDMIVPGVVDSDSSPIGLDQLTTARSGHAVEPDRREAIRAAVAAAGPADTVLIAGKGHEDYQILGREKVHFDDREEARAALAPTVHG